MFCISDEVPYLPSTVNNILVNLQESKKIILTLLDLIQNSFTANTCKDSNKVFNAIQAAFLLGKDNGGKLLVFNASNSMTITSKMKTNNIVNIPKEELIYTPTDDKQFANLGINMTNENVSVDLFISSDVFVNLITLNQLCDFTNGNLYFYKSFKLDIHYKNLFNQIRRVLTRPMSWEAVMRTRFSRGYKTNNIITPVLISNGDLLIMSTVDSDQTYTLQLDLSEIDPQSQQIQQNQVNNLNNEPFVYIQNALLYTHSDGTRRIRIHNLCIPITNKLFEYYESIDVEALATFYTKLTVEKIFKTKKTSNSVLSIEASYKAFINSVLSTQSTLKKELPDNLVYLPLYILGMLKHRICCKDEIAQKLDVDLSNYLRIKVQKLSLNDIMPFIFPRLYPIHQILYDNSLGYYDENNSVTLPAV
jgi:protein transport protein SEC24